MPPPYLHVGHFQLKVYNHFTLKYSTYKITDKIFIIIICSVQLAQALQPFNLKWIEECLHPDDYTGMYTVHGQRTVLWYVYCAWPAYIALVCILESCAQLLAFVPCITKYLSFSVKFNISYILGGGVISNASEVRW